MYFVYFLTNWDDSVLYIGVTPIYLAVYMSTAMALSMGLQNSLIPTSSYITNTRTMFIVLSPGKSNLKSGAVVKRMPLFIR